MADADGSGCISKEELGRLVQLIGCSASESAVARLMAEYDSDGSGVVEEEEFAALCEATFVAAATEPLSKTPLCESGSELCWGVPLSGWLVIKFEAMPSQPSRDEVACDSSVSGLLRLLANANSEQERTLVFDVATSQRSVFLTGEQARLVFEAARCEFSAVQKVARLLPQIGDAREVSTRQVTRGTRGA